MRCYTTGLTLSIDNSVCDENKDDILVWSNRIILYAPYLLLFSATTNAAHRSTIYIYIYNSSYSYNNYFCSLIRVELVKINLPYKSLFVLYRIGQEKIQRRNCSIYRFEAVWLGLAVSHLLKPRLKCKQVITKSQCH